MSDSRELFFKCEFVRSPRELVGSEPYVVLQDSDTEPFLSNLIETCRGRSSNRGIVKDAAAARSASQQGALIFTDGPTWHRCFASFGGEWPGPSLPRVLLYFTNDPSGFWDFARACGDGLARIIADRGMTSVAAKSVEPFLEHWTGARVSNGRIVPSVKYYGREYAAIVQENGAKVARVLSALADEESRATYTRILFGSQEQVFSSFADRVFGPQQYMDIVKIRPGDVIANCGVGSGWELPFFLSRLQGEGKILNFDPNMVYPSTSYGPFTGLFSDMLDDHKVILSDRDGTIDLPTSQSNMVRSDSVARDSSREGYETYPCRKFDTLWNEGLASRLDYLKMDVEGGEIFILRGALQTIRAQRPKLAVAIYHEIEHFWDYPCFLLDNLQDYRFYLRQYGYSRFETLLYCVPQEDTESGSGTEGLLSPKQPARLAAGPSQQIVLYFRDKKDAPRKMYAGDVHVLSRFAGRAWETGDIRHAPAIAADEIIGVAEGEDRTVYIAKHSYEPGNTQMIAGVSANGLDVEWKAATGVSGNTVGLLVASEDKKIRVIAYDPQHRAARLYRFEGDAFHTEFDLAFDGAPVAADMASDGALRLQIAIENGRFLIERVFRADGPTGAETVTATPGPIVGQVLVRQFGDKLGKVQRAYALENDSRTQLDLFVRDGTEFKPIGAMVWDGRFEIVASTVN